MLFITVGSSVGVFEMVGCVRTAHDGDEEREAFLVLRRSIYADRMLRCVSIRTHDPVIAFCQLIHSISKLDISNLQLFGFSASPSSKRMTCCSTSPPRSTLSLLDLDPAPDSVPDLDGDLVSTSSIFSSFSDPTGVSNSLSKFLKYAARELSSPAIFTR